MVAMEKVMPTYSSLLNVFDSQYEKIVARNILSHSRAPDPWVLLTRVRFDVATNRASKNHDSPSKPPTTACKVISICIEKKWAGWWMMTASGKNQTRDAFFEELCVSHLRHFGIVHRIMAMK